MEAPTCVLYQGPGVDKPNMTVCSTAVFSDSHDHAIRDTPNENKTALGLAKGGGALVVK